MRSLRGVVIARTMAMLALVGCCAAVAAYEAALFEANQFMDDYMRQYAEGAAGKPVLGATSFPLLEPEDRFERVSWRDGRVFDESPAAPRGLASPRRAGFGRAKVDGIEWRTYASLGGGEARVLAQRMSARRELARHAALEISLVIAATMAVVWLIVTATVRGAMNRFERLAATIAARGIDADGPLPITGLPAEVAPLVAAMNVLIARQGDALRRQRRFIADSAHELRTPLTALRIQIENLGGQDGGEAPARDETSDLRAGIVRAGAMLDKLLQLARFDGDRPDGAPGELDLGEVLKRCVADVFEIACDAGVDLGLVRCDEVRVRLSNADARALVSNIVDNAVGYTPAGGRVDCSLRRDGDAAVLEIVDSGPGVRPEDLPRLCDRFFRAAPMGRMGSGLGLAIVKAVADRNVIALSIDNRVDGTGLAVRARVPASIGSARPGDWPDGRAASPGIAATRRLPVR